MLLLLVLILLPLPARAADWPMWGRTPSRNMTCPETNLPSAFDPGKPKLDSEEIDPATTKNVKWVAKLGSQSYGNPTVAAGKIFVGTNNECPRDPKTKGDYGILMCLEEATGKLLWQLAVPKLAAGKDCDYDFVGICSSPTVEGDRAYLVTNRCEVVCLNINDGSVVWRYDMRDELGVFPHQMTASSVLIVGQRLYATTSNGRDWSGKHIPSPNSPALICLDKQTGKLLGQEDSGISRRMFLCNWSSPAFGRVADRDMIFFGGGDGFCYAFDPVPVKNAAGVDVLNEIWRFDCNPPQRRMQDGKPVRYGNPKGPSEIIATPAFDNGRVYVAVGQNPEKADGDGCLNCIDAASGKPGWSYEGIGRSISTVSIADGLLFAAEFAGRVRCLDARTGTVHWTYDTEANTWASPLVADGKLYIGNEEGTFTILAAGKKMQLVGKVDFLTTPIYSSAVVANGVLYIATANNLYAIQGGAKP